MNQHASPSQYRPSFDRAELDQKINASVDTKALKQTEIFAVGCVGSNNVYENLVRIGIRKLTVIDFDRVGPSNLVTQGWYGDQLGKHKVEALRENAARVLPTAQTETGALNLMPGDFLKLSDGELEHLAGDADLLMFMADDFYAQARGNRLALKLQKPAIFAMMYDKARCCEVTFIIPGVTPACHRCATSSRYESYLAKGYSNDVTSDGSLIFQTHAINSIIGMLALAILHNDRPGYEFS